MKRCFLLSACLLLLAAIANGENTNNKSLLWKVSGKRIKTSYLFGTIHLICPADYIWTDKMKESLDKSEEVCFEMDMSDPGIMNEIALGFIDNSGKTLRDYFTPADYAKLEQYVRDTLNSNIAMFKQLKPVALQTLITTRSSNCPEPISYEEKILKDAQAERKKITGLELPEEQIAVLESIPTDSIIVGIMKTINGNYAADNEYDDLIRAYKEQDLPALYALISGSKDMASELGIFLDERNRKWISRMTAKMARHSDFFAVGAGHLWGPNGIIALLRKAGYIVEPVI